MSDFGLFEADEAAADEPRRQARTAARKLDAAIDAVRVNFGRFLLGATGIDEFEDRWHLSKNDIRASVEPLVFPNTGTMRRIQNAMKSDWKLAHPYKLAMDHDDAGFGSMPEGDSHRNQDLDETYSPSSGNLVPSGDFEGYKNSVDQDGPEKVEANDFTPGGDSGSDRTARRTAGDLKREYGHDVCNLCGYEIDPDNRGHYENPDDPSDRCRAAGRFGSRRIDVEAAKLVADIYTDFAQSNGLRVASIRSLNAYASTGIADADYRILANLIRIAEDEEAEKAAESDDEADSDDKDDDYDFGGEDDAEGHDEPDADNEGGPSDHDADNEDDDDADSDDDDDDYDFGGDDDDSDGGQTYTVPDQAPDLDPQMLDEIPHDDPQGAAPVPPEVIDSLLGLPEGTIEQLLLEEVEQGQGGSDGYGAPEQGAPQGGGDDFLGEGGDDAEQEPSRMAARRRFARLHQAKNCTCWKGYKRVPGTKPCAEGSCEKCDSHRKSSRRQAREFWAAPDESEDELTERQKREQKDSLDTQHESWMKSKAARRFWAADDEQPAEGGGGEQQAAPAQDPAAAMGGMQQPMMPPPGSGAVAPPAPPQQLEDQPAEDALLDTANQAIMQMIDRETQEYQQIIDPLSQALQAIQFAQQVESTEHPMDVTPPQGTVDVSPAAAPGGAQSMQQQASRRSAGSDRNITRHEDGSSTWPCENCGDTVARYRGQGDTECDSCNAQYNAFGQRLRDNWRDNRSNYDEDYGDMEGYEDSFHDAAKHARLARKKKVALRNAATVIAQKHRLSATGERMLLEAMGRGNYEHVREALQAVPREYREAPANHIGHLFAADNPRFSRDQWMRSVMAATSKDRYETKSYTGPRDKRRDEHGRQDMADAQAEDEQNHWEDDPDYRKLYNREGSRGRLPFDRPRLAGETLTPTPTMDAFEFPNAGHVNHVSDNITGNELPKMKGTTPHQSALTPRQADIMHSLQTWLTKQKAKGLVDYGDTAAEGFLNSRSKPLGERATELVHTTVGAPAHPPVEEAPAKVRVPKAVNPVTKKGSFFTRRVPGWKWDDHLAGYISKEARTFTCSCGETVGSPSYKMCRCGKIWNVYAIGDTHHLASDTADMYIAREIPVRDNVIMANRKLASVEGLGEWESGHQSLPGDPTPEDYQAAKNWKNQLSREHEDWFDDDDEAADKDFNNYWRNREKYKTLSLPPERLPYQGWNPDKKQDPFDPRLMGASRRAQATFRQYLAEINRLAADNSGSPHNPGTGSGVIPDTKYFPTNTPGAGGIGADRTNKGGQFNDGIKIDTSHAQIDEAPPAAATTEGIGVGGFGQPDPTTNVGRMNADNTLMGGGGSFGDNSTSQSKTPDTFNGTPSLKSGGRIYADNLAMIERLADWTKYDGPDPSRDPKAKPPSTKIPKQPKDWTKRTFTGPDKGKWTSESDTFTPKNK